MMPSLVESGFPFKLFYGVVSDLEKYCYFENRPASAGRFFFAGAKEIFSLLRVQQLPDNIIDLYSIPVVQNTMISQKAQLLRCAAFRNHSTYH